MSVDGTRRAIDNRFASPSASSSPMSVAACIPKTIPSGVNTEQPLEPLYIIESVSYHSCNSLSVYSSTKAETNPPWNLSVRLTFKWSS